MGPDCILCESTVENHATLPRIIEAFKIILKVLETRAISIEKEKTAELHDINLRLKQELARSNVLEEERKSAEKRSDLYKKRFLDAQEAIEELHEKNIQLSSQRKLQRESVSQETIRNFPFAPPRQARDELSPRTKRIILAPDTCYTNAESCNDSICISSDEEDFKPDPKRKCKSPHQSPKVKKTSPQPAVSVADSFFAKPKSPPIHIVKKKSKQHSSASDTDLDETRLDSEFPMETSFNIKPTESAKHVEAMSDADIWDLCNEMDSIPPSPVLSAGKGKRFGSLSGTRFSGNYTRKENSSPSLLDGKNVFIRFPTLTKSTHFEAKETEKDLTGSDTWDKSNIMSDSLPLHRLRQATPLKQSGHGNTSLDELFDKTYGDLETTTMMDNTTMNASKYEDSDAELEELPRGAQDVKESYIKEEDNISDPEKANNASSSCKKILNPAFYDSFDVLPKKIKEKNFKYQEVVRKRNEREKLYAKACAQCEAYYCDLSEDERRDMMRKVCRHKHVDAPPSTPEHFWEIGIPDTAECRKRGYINDETKLPTSNRQDVQRLRRKKPLESYFSPKRK